jgi:hypothetical protein
MKDAIKKIYERVKLATQGRWGPYSANLPFHAIVTKPAPSLSKHDTEEPTYWRCEDAIFVAHAVEDILYLLGELSEADVVCKQLIRSLEDQKSQNKVAELRMASQIESNKRAEFKVLDGLMAELAAKDQRVEKLLEKTENQSRSLHQKIVKIAILEGQIKSLFEKLKNGDEKHQQWLKKTIEEHFPDLKATPEEKS